MKTQDGFRYSLVFSADTAEKQRVGAFLEGCGHKKSSLVVAALAEYLDRHPELEAPGGKIEIKVKQTLTRADIEAIVRETLAKNGGVIAGGRAETQDGQPVDEPQQQYDAEHINRLVGLLDECFE